MKQALKKTEKAFFYYVDEKKIYGTPPDVTGDMTGLRGDVTGIIGKATGIKGCIDDCEISKEDRERGVKIEDLVK